MSSLILLNKPYKVLCQFTGDDGRDNLSTYIKEPGFYPAGRLDFDSEGLLLLTNDGNLQHFIAHPTHKLPKKYWVQVEGAYNPAAVKHLTDGVVLKDGLTKPAQVCHIEAPNIWDRNPPIRHRQSIPTHWLEISITEGRNRQIRRMTAAVNLPTLRLIRSSIGDWSLGDLMPGEHCIKALTLSVDAMVKANTVKNNRNLSKSTEKNTRKKNHSNKYKKRVRDKHDK
jgi:23S rRNA pseudouridine2457 synthase